jgi:DNA-binding protein YbaB
MKNSLLFFILLLSGMAGAQIVNIPDPAFKNFLLTSNAINSNGNVIVINANGDNEIQVSEALAVWEISIDGLSGDPIVSLTGIEAFMDLRKIKIISIPIISLDCTSLTNLEELNISICDELVSLTVAGLHNLKKITLNETDITSLDCTGLTSLEELDLVEVYELATLNIQGLPGLKKIKIDSADIASLDCSGLNSLEELDIQIVNELTALNISGLPNLKKVSIDETALTSLDCTGLTSLEELTLDASVNLTSLIIEDFVGLKRFVLRTTNLTSLDLTTAVDLEFLYLSSNEHIGSLDLSNCTQLKKLWVFMNGGQEPAYLNLKNGIIEYEIFVDALYVGSGDAPLYLCIDEGNEGLLSASTLSNPKIFISTYCSFMPGGNYNTISGDLTFDSDNNGCDGNDSYAGFVRMGITDGTESFSAFTASGQYNFFTQTGTFTLTPELENDWFTVTPPSATINLATVDNSTTAQNFCITANGVHPDVEVVITPTGTAQPGFDADYKIVYKNKGNQTLSGAVTLNYDDSVLDHVSSYPSETTSATSTLTWNYTDLLPFESRSMYATFNLNGPMETPPVNLDDVLSFTVSVTPATGDETPADNLFLLSQVVAGSFDPNDIACLEGRSVSPEKIGEYLHYNINFENTGTAPATFIVVKDVIDETKFDVSTLQLMDASHNVETRVTGNKVEFYFDAINLGPEEKGNVIFKIKTLNSLQLNDDVTQQADIFFDYNWPIQTNEAVTIFEVLGIGEYEFDNYVKVYPNPAKDIVTISADSNISSIDMYDMQGRTLQSGVVNGQEVRFDMASRGSGIYFIKIVTEKGIKVEKVVKE